jgi:hypothetical protein
MTPNRNEVISESLIPLDTLRRLRGRAQDLLESMIADLIPFKHEDGYTFLRTPDSKPTIGDVNVTTTCSCVMALASANKFREFYGSDSKKAANEVLDKLVKAPWMSSGLILNNAFTTTLVLRTYGFLKQHHLLPETPPDLKKKWSLNYEAKNVKKLVAQIDARDTDAMKFVYRSLPDSTRALFADVDGNAKKLSSALTADLRRIMQSGWIYEKNRFGDRDAGVQAVLNPFNAYKVTEFNYDLLASIFPEEIKPLPLCSFGQIAQEMASREQNFAINDYPASAAVGYWFVDGISRAGFTLDSDNWKVQCEWARKEFNRQHSLVLANQDALMDPIAMAMAACLCARLHSISGKSSLGMTKDHLSLLPSQIELEHAITTLFDKQADSGIWPKYFPMFHYQDQGAGSNFCFAFELLEGVLNEFGKETSHLLENAQFIAGMSKAVHWCEQNRLSFKGATRPYEGWNSGGYITTLQKNQPESWATAVVHMFLYELIVVLSEHIQRRILRKYQAEPTLGKKDETAFNDLLDIDLLLQGQSDKLKSVLRTRLIAPNDNNTEAKLRRGNPMKPTSALLFGPPGTSKTNVTEAVAKALGWSLVTITPSHFVKGTFAQVYEKADEIFDDVMDLAGVVVFFDEMDALMQSREKGALDTATQFLTTAMLPKLVQLHDLGRVIFFMATNYQDKFDPAIKRAGRFDLLLCMGPPTLEEKLAHLPRFFKPAKLKDSQEVKLLIEEYANNNALLKDQLRLFTFAEFRSFLKRIGNASNLAAQLKVLGSDGFRQKAADFGKYVTLSMNDLPEGLEKKIWDWDEFPLEKKDEALEKEIARYFRDWKISRAQYDQIG